MENLKLVEYFKDSRMTFYFYGMLKVLVIKGKTNYKTHVSLRNDNVDKFVLLDAIPKKENDNLYQIISDELYKSKTRQIIIKYIYEVEHDPII